MSPCTWWTKRESPSLSFLTTLIGGQRQNIDYVSSMLQQNNLILKLVDVAGAFASESKNGSIEIVSALSPEEYLRALEEASGFYLEYLPTQDPVLGFYGDSLKFRDFWNTNKPILLFFPNAVAPTRNSRI